MKRKQNKIAKKLKNFVIIYLKLVPFFKEVEKNPKKFVPTMSDILKIIYGGKKYPDVSKLQDKFSTNQDECEVL